MDLDFNSLVRVSFEFDDLLHVAIVLSRLRTTILNFDSSESDLTLNLLLVVDLDLECATSLRDGVLQVLEAPIIVSEVLGKVVGILLFKNDLLTFLDNLFSAHIDKSNLLSVF